MPTPDYYDRHKNFGRTFVNLGDKDGFSGFVIYHDLNGFFVNADRYDDGEMTAQAYDEGNDAADRYAAAQLLGDTELYGNGPSLYSLHIEAPEVTATACQTCKMQNCQCKMNGALPCECLGSETEQQKDTTKKDPKPQGGGGGPRPTKTTARNSSRSLKATTTAPTDIPKTSAEPETPLTMPSPLKRARENPANGIHF